MFDILPSTQTRIKLQDKKQLWTICFHYVIQISGHIIISNSAYWMLQNFSLTSSKLKRCFPAFWLKQKREITICQHLRTSKVTSNSKKQHDYILWLQLISVCGFKNTHYSKTMYIYPLTEYAPMISTAEIKIKSQNTAAALNIVKHCNISQYCGTLDIWNKNIFPLKVHSCTLAVPRGP